MFKYIFARLSEASTWRGIILAATAAGVNFNPEQTDAIIALGLASAGFVGVFFKDKLSL